MAAAIAPHVPHLRRFARALTGSQSSGDAYVAVTLSAIVENPSVLPEGVSDRVALFHLFLKIWNSVDINGTSEPVAELVAEAAAADRKLEQIRPLPRQAFLLTTLEDFSTEEAALALDLEDTEVQNLIDEAARDIAAQVATDVLIIEDEPLIALDLEECVTSLGHGIASVARTRGEAVALVQRKRPGLILADIHLADGSSGIDAVNDLLEGLNVPVIFITAYPERLLTGERPEPTFLITKPFQPAMVKAVVSQALFFERNAGHAMARE